MKKVKKVNICRNGRSWMACCLFLHFFHVFSLFSLFSHLLADWSTILTHVRFFFTCFTFFTFFTFAIWPVDHSYTCSLFSRFFTFFAFFTFVGWPLTRSLLKSRWQKKLPKKVGEQGRSYLLFLLFLLLSTCLDFWSHALETYATRTPLKETNSMKVILIGVCGEPP